MIFLKNIMMLLDKFENCSCGTKDKAFLYGLRNSTPPIATHIVFAPMPKNISQDLVNDYKRAFPAELLTLYSTMNGADLFWTVRTIGKKNRQIPISRLSIYGVPLTCDRQHIEPFNIRIEDLKRPTNTPDSWLKFGSYYSSVDADNRLDLFVDTETNVVFAVKNNCNECSISETWSSIDCCLCFLLEYFTSKTGDGSVIDPV